ncbi:MAG TPA: DNA-directed DNA polymerase II small subunit [Candidatus Thermoplasmatota archaeon]|nr:DNA-directed DNA polymerase II small subunit [Candidatus Thermoplasmatota archaeon]
MNAVLAELARRGTLVAPDALARLQAAPQLAEGLLARPDLPFLLTAAHLEAAAGVPAPVAPAPTVFPASTGAALLLEPLVTAPPAPARPEPPAPFTPDVRGALLVEPEVPAPRRALGEPLPPRPTLMDAYAHQVEILADVTGNSTCEGAISDFTKYFNDRLNKIRKMLRQRREMVGFVPVGRARAGGANEVKLVGIVTEIRTTKNGHRLIELEDETGAVNILAPASDANLLMEADTIIEDEVIGVVCKPPGRGDLLILQHVVRPDIPMAQSQRRSGNASAVAVLSDIHFGSKTFLSDDWERFLRWINLEWGDSRMKALARKVRYLVVNGDVVDGIGIFPGQEEELAIVDAYDQYAFAGEQLNRIRDDVQIFVLPGNHDLVRPAEPQPALPEKYKRLFPDTVTHVGNPCKLSIEGVEVLSYHGRSMDDWITRVSGLSYDDPIKAMKEMILRRHMVPVYGLRTPIAPEHKDYLAIDTVPDVFVTGHVHAAGVDSYRGVTLINASCWQSQTAYQKMHGFMPDPSKVPVFELDTGKPWMVDFHRGKPAGVDVVGRSQFGGAFRQPAEIANPGDVV